MKYYIRPATDESVEEVEHELKDFLFSPSGFFCFCLTFFIGSLNTFIGGFLFVSFIVSIVVFSRSYFISPLDSFQPTYLGTGKAFLLSILFSFSLIQIATIEPTVSVNEIINTPYEHDSIKDKDKRIDFIKNNSKLSDEEEEYLLLREKLKDDFKNKKSFFDNSILKMFFLTVMFSFILFVLLFIGYSVHTIILSLYLFRLQKIKESISLSRIFDLCHKATTSEIKKRFFKHTFLFLFLVSFFILASDFFLSPLLFSAAGLWFLYISYFYQKHIYVVDSDVIEIINA